MLTTIPSIQSLSDLGSPPVGTRLRGPQGRATSRGSLLVAQIAVRGTLAAAALAALLAVM